MSVIQSLRSELLLGKGQGTKKKYPSWIQILSKYEVNKQ